jgi:hypothetical protein
MYEMDRLHHLRKSYEKSRTKSPSGVGNIRDENAVASTIILKWILQELDCIRFDKGHIPVK